MKKNKSNLIIGKKKKKKILYNDYRFLDGCLRQLCLVSNSIYLPRE